MITSTPPLPPLTPPDKLVWWYTRVWARWLRKVMNRGVRRYATAVTDAMEDSVAPVLALVALAVLAAFVTPGAMSKMLSATFALWLLNYAAYYARSDTVQEKEYRRLANGFFWASASAVLLVSVILSLFYLLTWIKLL